MKGGDRWNKSENKTVKRRVKRLRGLKILNSSHPKENETRNGSEALNVERGGKKRIIKGPSYYTSLLVYLALHYYYCAAYTLL